MVKTRSAVKGSAQGGEDSKEPNSPVENLKSRPRTHTETMSSDAYIIDKLQQQRKIDAPKNIFSIFKRWIDDKYMLYKVTFGLYMLDPWEQWMTTTALALFCCLIFYGVFLIFNRICGLACGTANGLLLLL
mmetsp:Transcript_38043/g.45905  ORF Transcript_38043/g.45905 Transcript_38043/m.45905 type:complete len:131 (+) Transcript_38043:350-742(+)|eukprot:CAMPEP_0197864408 /NCGR_PEP_ID=MMETSP1438-20131217/42651_1 /TAXON_ID=1461541 /ORGANISM="Pterosperma sp., Strain CCMP1384" /LENGTH=130 /DNA_ID=CAMNT_0043482653 /DNA_START=348 /DNA_END=740 /DNA_ORIENTATION=+